MVDEKEAARDVEAPESEKGDGKKGGKKSGKKGGKKILLIAPLAVIALAAGGYFGFAYMSKEKGSASAAGSAKEGKAKSVLFSLEPFVVNLSEPGRYLKVTMQMEIAGESNQALASEKVPILRDTIITLISSQSYEYVSSPEGKLQLKDDILLRTNQIFGKEVFRELYFTEFVMQ